MQDGKHLDNAARFADYLERLSKGTLPIYTPIKEGVSIRLLSPLGNYPLGEFRHPQAAFVAKPGLLAMVTAFNRIETPEDYSSEAEFLSAFEIRLLATILLSRKPDSGMFRMYPTFDPYLEKGYVGLDLSNSLVLDDLIGEFETLLRSEPPSADFHTPQVIGGTPYEFNEDAELDYDRQAEIFASIDVRDHLAIRGLGALIRANMLGFFPEFLENACVSLWIALETSQKIIYRELRKNGLAQPTPQDAADFLDDAFESLWESDGYFRDYYEGRVKTIHPESRFGVYSAAPLEADDYYILHRQLFPVYDFLLTRYVAAELKRR